MNNNDGLPAWFWLLILFGAGWFISALMDAGEPTRIDTESSNEIDYIVLDGMPCAIVDGHEKFAISCDWSKWNGQIEDGVITFPLQNTYEEPIATYGDDCSYIDEWDIDHYKEPCDNSTE